MADPSQPSASSASIHSDIDIEASTPNIASIQGGDAKQPEEVVDGLAGVQASGSTAHLVGQVNEGDFVEGGLEGWTAVLGCTLVIAVTGGVLTLLSTSCFETHSTATHKAGAYHSKTLLKGTSHAKLSAIGRFIATGCIITFLGQFGASWSRDFWSIFLTQGLLQGLGCGSLLPMISAIPSQWFRRHRGVATGIVVAGASFGGAVSSLVVQVNSIHILPCPRRNNAGWILTHQDTIPGFPDPKQTKQNSVVRQTILQGSCLLEHLYLSDVYNVVSTPFISL
ncbi:MFS_1 domain-containing protein [Rhizoctonia solani AG-1 IA]|uniref:MFS_1 domain-containing protein n=1 Tax=Thanatephorus cucumeris (strain AG1-IA) TaxID=983506 RepID=L8WP14_THACA|nr:MFS_1 domain-containing protein [Rhizoctonia solani AG-1 IA]